MKTMGLAWLAIAGTTAILAQDITGEWNGTLKVGQAELRLVLHVSKGADNNLKATLDSIHQGVNGIPVRENCRLDFEGVHQQVIRAEKSLKRVHACCSRNAFRRAYPDRLTGRRVSSPSIAT
jgi:hypothetical protein